MYIERILISNGDGLQWINRQTYNQQEMIQGKKLPDGKHDK